MLYSDLGIRNGSRGWNMGINGQEKLRTGRRRKAETGWGVQVTGEAVSLS